MRVSILMLLLALAPLANAEIYHYVDDQGRKVFVDSLRQVPMQYRDQLETRAEVRGQTQPEVAVEKSGSLEEIRRQLAQAESEFDDLIAELETEVSIRGNQVIVPVRARYGNRRADARLLLDTGASGTLFHQDAVARLRGNIFDAGKARVASGEVIDVQALNLDRLEVGPFKTRAMRVSVIEPASRAAYDGLLGMDFLRKVEYRIDYDNERIIWQPSRHDELVEQRDRLVEQQQMADEELIAVLREEAGEEAPTEPDPAAAP